MFWIPQRVPNKPRSISFMLLVSHENVCSEFVLKPTLVVKRHPSNFWVSGKSLNVSLLNLCGVRCSLWMFVSFNREPKSCTTASLRELLNSYCSKITVPQACILNTVNTRSKWNWNVIMRGTTNALYRSTRQAMPPIAVDHLFASKIALQRPRYRLFYFIQFCTRSIVPPAAGIPHIYCDSPTK